MCAKFFSKSLQNRFENFTDFETEFYWSLEKLTIKCVFHNLKKLTFLLKNIYIYFIYINFCQGLPTKMAIKLNVL